MLISLRTKLNVLHCFPKEIEGYFCQLLKRGKVGILVTVVAFDFLGDSNY
jgi:hypothetical protein